ncbi:unnamed protein product [Sphenostylis stenocarpa]|uniref:Uncharacterized protein n=1 Tax=Sphenostylis stenocarpa TaxID=92480 RepID=A0AA86SYL2_9FABA|nr:unnamed protein product [Sphenostylis stenocarpa]
MPQLSTWSGQASTLHSKSNPVPPNCSSITFMPPLRPFTLYATFDTPSCNKDAWLSRFCSFPQVRASAFALKSFVLISAYSVIP